MKPVKFQDPFARHTHAHEDERFYVVRGSFNMEFRDQAEGPASRTVTPQADDLIVVPRGHRTPACGGRGG